MKKLYDHYLAPLKDGLNVMVIQLLILIIFLVLFIFLKYTIIMIFIYVLLIFILLTINFFRSPDRKIHYKKNTIYAPADGVVSSVDIVNEKEYIKQKCYRLKIFMNIFNVHRNRIPLSGEIKLVKYKKGKMSAAFKEVEESNEQFIILIKTKQGLILMKQIAGLIARRIVCHLKMGDKVKVGDIFGMIKFGSAVVLYLPKQVNIMIKKTDKVKAGLTILGKI